jgi:CHAT domain-containing protein
MREAYARPTRGVRAPQRRGATWQDTARLALDSLAALLPHAALAALPDGTELVVVPDGVLGQVPFAALRVRAGGVRPYLVERFAVRQAPSLATLAAAEAVPTRLRGAGPGTPAAELVGGALVASWWPPGAPLAWADVERDSVARLLGVTALPAAEATERRISAALTTAPVVHLAAHGRASADPRWTRDSTGVQLRPAARARSAHVPAVGDAHSDRRGDGFLSAGDLLDRTAEQRLVAELVVLSACETALGAPSRTEGTLGLPRALLAAGARTVVTSLWIVDDAASAALLTAFWRHWLTDADRPSAAEALRRAQRRAARTYPPYFWAAFQVAGAS